MGLHHGITKNRKMVRLMVLMMALMCVKRCTVDTVDPAGNMAVLGQNSPKGRIYLDINTALDIECTLHTNRVEDKYPGKTVDDLVFIHNGKLVGDESLSRISNTTMKLHIEHPAVSESTYYCKLKLDNQSGVDSYQTVDWNKVIVGYKPLKPRKFSCISENWERLTCSWDPLTNPVPTTFDLTFSIQGSNSTSTYHCPSLVQNQCVIETPKNQKDMGNLSLVGFKPPVHVRRDSIYYFTLMGLNELGNVTFPYTVELSKYVKLAKPKDLDCPNVTSSSVLLTWKIPSFSEQFSLGFVHKIEYRSGWNRESWKNISILKQAGQYAKMYYNLTGLEYANTLYKVRVYIRTGTANDENMWSDFSSVKCRTKPTAPGAVPRTDIGSFEIIPTRTGRNVHLYWRGIPSYLENGDNFTYKIVEKNGKELSSIENHVNYTMLEGITSDSYEFNITSMNEIGKNPHQTNILVPSQAELPGKPKDFIKIDFGNGSYVLSWEQPAVNRDIVNYTIFWCENHQDRPHQCTGYLNWIHVPKNTTTYNMNVPNLNSTYQFAISANTAGASSGMVWTSCTVIQKKNIGRMKSVRVNRIGSTFIEVGLKLDCSDRIGIIQGFNVYCCEISPPNVECDGPELKMTIKKDSHNIHGIVDDLKPSTTYKVTVTMFTMNRESLRSVPLYKATSGSSSTSPRYVQVFGITNNSMSVSWKPPETLNGEVSYYEVYYNNLTERVEKESLQLENLLPFHNYSVRVAACTSFCGPPSPPINGITNIDVPGKIEILQVRPLNSDQVLLAWQIPSHSAGYLDYYEIGLNNGTIERSNSTSATLPFPDCTAIGENVVYQYRVRAVNIAPNDIHLKGPWSDTEQGYCYIRKSSSLVSIVIWIIVGVCILVALWCIADTIKTKISCQSKLNQTILFILQQQAEKEENGPVYSVIDKERAENHEKLVRRGRRHVTFAEDLPFEPPVSWNTGQSSDGLYSVVNIGV